MNVVTSDKIGLLQFVSNEESTNKNFLIQQNLLPSLDRKINYMTWSGGFGGYDETEVTIARSSGLIESFSLYPGEIGTTIAPSCNCGFVTPFNCIYTKMLNSHHQVVYETMKENNIEGCCIPYDKYDLLDLGIYEEYLSNDRLLLSVNTDGYVHVVNWNEEEDNKFKLAKDKEAKWKYDKESLLQIYAKNYKKEVLDKIEYTLRVDNETCEIKKKQYKHVYVDSIIKDYHYNEMITNKAIVQSWILSNPIDAVETNEILTNRLAIGGNSFGLKVFDLFTGKYMWSSKRIGMSLLSLNCETSIKSIGFLNEINVNVLVVGTYDKKLILYDMRNQKKPVHVYDYHKTQNVVKNKNNCYDQLYSEPDLIFTRIATLKHIVKCEDPKMYHKEKVKKKKKIKWEESNVTEILEPDDIDEYDSNSSNNNVDDNNEDDDHTNNDIENMEKGKEDAMYTYFNINQMIEKNKKALQKLIKKSTKKKKKEYSINEITNVEKNQINTFKWGIKKFNHKDSQHIYVSDNYGNIYDFHIITRLKLLQLIYEKQCAEKKITYEQKDTTFLLEHQKELYDYYKNFQESNRSHWRNDIPYVYGKKNSLHFLIELSKKFKVSNGGISFLDIHKNGKYLCAASFERYLYILNIEKKKIQSKIHIGHLLTGCLFISNRNQKKNKILQNKKTNLKKRKKITEDEPANSSKASDKPLKPNVLLKKKKKVNHIDDME